MSSFITKLTSKRSQRFTKPGSKPLYLSQPFVETHVVKGSFRTIVRLPRGIEENEFLAANTFDFFQNLNLFYGSVADYCTTRDCPNMLAGPNSEFAWTDSQKKLIKLPAPQYIDYVMSWIQNLLDDEAVFPTRTGLDFPREFPQIVKQIHRQLYRVFAHLFWHHYDMIINLRCEGHFNSLFAHFIAFNKEFDLVDRKEMKEMNDLILEFEAQGRLS